MDCSIEAGAAMVKVQKQELSLVETGDLSLTCRIGRRHPESCRSTGIEELKFVQAVPELRANRWLHGRITRHRKAFGQDCRRACGRADEQLGKED